MSHATVQTLYFDQMEMRVGVPMVDRTLLRASRSPPLTKAVRFQSPIDPRSSAVRTIMKPAVRRPATPTADSSESDDHDGKQDELLEENSGGIPKPEGEVGRPGRGGYNLQATLKWSRKTWRDVHNFVKHRVLDTMDCSLPYSEQPMFKLRAVREEALARFPFLNDYERLWVVDDLVRCRLKYEKSALKRKADAKLAEEARAKSKQSLTISIPSKRRSD
ncbi:hypothetical protein C8R42DRAFT_645838 [Lentinula raphanica]|nr:hypothetical protein C8R42DRAFT_645838 [Lentinula raphanica]